MMNQPIDSGLDYRALLESRNEHLDDLTAKVRDEGHVIILGLHELLEYLDAAWMVGVHDAELYQMSISRLHYGPPPIVSSPFKPRTDRWVEG